MLVQLGALEVEGTTGHVLVCGQLATGGAFLQRRVAETEVGRSSSSAEPGIVSAVGQQLGHPASHGQSEAVDRRRVKIDRGGIGSPRLGSRVRSPLHFGVACSGPTQPIDLDAGPPQLAEDRSKWAARRQVPSQRDADPNLPSLSKRAVRAE